MAFKIDSKKIAKNTLTLYIRQAISMLITFFTVRKTLELLGVVDLGLNNLVGSIVSMFTFVSSSMVTGVQRFLSIEIGRDNKDGLKDIFGVGLYLHLVIALITFFATEIFAFFFLDKMNIPFERLFAAHAVFQFSAISLLLGIMSLPYVALLRAREMFSWTAFVDISQAFLRLGVLYLLVVSPIDKLITLSFFNLCISFAGIVAFVIMAYQFEESHSKPLRDKVLIGKMLKFVSFMTVSGLALLFNTQGVVLLINLFFGLSINAAYAVSIQVQNAVNTFVSNFKASMVPQIMAAYGADDLNSMHRLINFGTKATFLMLLMVTFPIIVSAHWILEIWLEKPPQYAAELVILVLISININSFSYFQNQGVQASGKITQQQMWISSSYLISIAVIYFLFKIGMPFYMAIIVNMVIGILRCYVNLYYAKITYNYSLRDFCKNVLFPVGIIVLFSVGMFSCINSMLNGNFIKLVCSIIIDFMLAFIGLLLMFNADERKKLLKFFRK